MQTAQQPVPGEQHDGQPAAPATLGDVLYPDRSSTAVPESDWAALVRSVAAGDPLALHALYERAHRVVFTVIVRITANRETAEELTVDVFHDVWRRAAGYSPANGTVLGWIMNQARSRAIDRLRHDQRKKRVAPEGADAAGEAPDAAAQLEIAQQNLLVRQAVAALSDDERKAIEAAFFSGLTYAEVAARFGVPLGTIKTRIRSGLHKLRHEMAAQAGKA